MNITTRAKALVGAVAIGGAAIAMGGAFTAGGIDGTAVEENPVFIGGSTHQTVHGATVDGVDYNLSADGLTVTSVNLTFTADTWAAVEDETFTVLLDSMTSKCTPNTTNPDAPFMGCVFDTAVATDGSHGELDITIASDTNVNGAG